MTKKFVVDNTSPYFVHPSEGSGILITVVIFDGENYNLWEKAVTTALRSKKKLEFVNGTIELKDGADQSDVYMRAQMTKLSIFVVFVIEKTRKVKRIVQDWTLR